MRAIILELSYKEELKPFLVTLDEHDRIIDAVCLDSPLGKRLGGKVIKVIREQASAIMKLENGMNAYIKEDGLNTGDTFDVTIIREAYDKKPVTVSRADDAFSLESYLLGLFGIEEISVIEDEFLKTSIRLRVQKQLDRALAGVFFFENGDIKIERTTALTVIDVNAASDNAFAANTNAVSCIVSAIRLLNVSGLIVIDFINMKSKEDQEAIKKLLTDELTSKDYATFRVGSFSEFGLLEITRKRVFSPLT